MKKILTLIFILFSITAFSQRVIVTDTLMAKRVKLRGVNMDSLSTDVTFSAPANTKVASTTAIKSYVDNSIADSLTALSLSVLEDSIVVLYSNGNEVARDTIPGIGGGGDGLWVIGSGGIETDSVVTINGHLNVNGNLIVSSADGVSITVNDGSVNTIQMTGSRTYLTAPDSVRITTLNAANESDESVISIVGATNTGKILRHPLDSLAAALRLDTIGLDLIVGLGEEEDSVKGNGTPALIPREVRNTTPVYSTNREKNTIYRSPSDYNWYLYDEQFDVGQKIKHDLTVSDVSQLQFLFAKNGQRCLVRSTGISYLVQEDEVPYFITDGEYVQALASGNFAVADLSAKREFDTYQDFKRLVPLLRLDGSTQTYKVGNEELLLSATPYPVSNINNTVYSDTIVDGVFLDTVSVDYNSINLVRYSHLGHNGGSSLHNAFIITPSTNYYGINHAIGPTGKKTATAFINGTISVYTNKPITPNDTTTVSFWAKTKNGLAASVIFDVESSPGSKTITITNPSEWKRYEGFHIVGAIPASSFVLLPSVTSGDTLLIDDLQLEDGVIATAYKETFFNVKTTDKMYINRGYGLLNEGKLDLSKQYGYPTIVSVTSSGDREYIQDAIDYCDYGRRCNEVVLAEGSYSPDSTIVIPQYITLTGVTSNKSGTTNPTTSIGGFTLNIRAGFKGEDVIQVKPVAGALAARGAGISNCRIVLNDTVRCLFYIEEVNYSKFENLSTRNETGFFSKIGMVVQVQGGSDSYINKFDNLFFPNQDSIGIEYNGSTANYFHRIDVTGSSVGIVINGGQGSWWDGVYAQSNDTSIVVRGGNAFVDDLYTEGSGNGIGGSVIKMTGGALRIENSTIQVNDGVTDTLLNLIGGRLDISNTQFRTNGGIHISDDFHYVYAEKTSWTSDPRKQFIGQDVNLKLKDCYNHTTGKDFVSNELRTEHQNSFLIDNVVSNNTLSDTLFLSDVTIKDKSENLIAHSDTILVANGAEISGGADDVVIRHNTVAAPDGTMTAETISFVGDDIGGATIFIESSRAMLDRLDIGDDYVISFWLYSFTGKLMSFPFTFRAFGDTDNELTGSALKLEANQWHKVYITGKIVDDTGSDLLTIRLNQPQSNVIIDDSIAVWRFSVQRGTFPSTSIRTTTAGIEAGDGNPTVIIPSGKILEFDGIISVSNELRFGKDISLKPSIYAYDGVNPSIPDSTETNLSFFNYNTSTAGLASFVFSGSNLTPTSGTSTDVWLQRTFAPTSGTADYAAMTILPVINQTGGANGQTYGLVIDPVLTSAADFVGIDVRAGGVTVDGILTSSGKLVTLGAAATTMAINGNVVTVTGDAGANVLATITGGKSGQFLTLIFVDALVTITDDGSGTANTMNLSAAFVSTANATITFVHNGTSWFEVCRSVN